MKMKCIIADDEPIARKGLEGYVEKVPFLELVATVPDGLAVIEKLSLEPVDLLILDINMPHLSGIQMMRTLKQPPLTIFVTAHPEYAVEGFELDVVDYIIKPVSFERFLKAVHKAKEYAALKQASNVEASYFFIKEGSTIEKIILDEIVFIQSLQNYSAIYTTDRKYMALLSLKQLEENLPKTNF